MRLAVRRFAALSAVGGRLRELRFIPTVLVEELEAAVLASLVLPLAPPKGAGTDFSAPAEVEALALEETLPLKLLRDVAKLAALIDCGLRTAELTRSVPPWPRPAPPIILGTIDAVGTPMPPIPMPLRPVVLLTLLLLLLLL